MLIDPREGPHASARTVLGLRRPQSKSRSLYVAPSTQILSRISSLVVSVSRSYIAVSARALSSADLSASIHASLCRRRGACTRAVSARGRPGAAGRRGRAAARARQGVGEGRTSCGLPAMKNFSFPVPSLSANAGRFIWTSAFWTSTATAEVDGPPDGGAPTLRRPRGAVEGRTPSSSNQYSVPSLRTKYRCRQRPRMSPCRSSHPTWSAVCQTSARVLPGQFTYRQVCASVAIAPARSPLRAEAIGDARAGDGEHVSVLARSRGAPPFVHV